MTKLRKPAKRQPKPRSSDPRQLSLIDLIEQDRLKTEQKETVGRLLKAKLNTAWRGRDLIPPGSFLEKVVSVFERTTDFPLEIPAIMVLHMLAAYLLDRNVILRVVGSTTRPDLWTTVLAPSGSGKSQVAKILRQVIPVRLFPEPTTSARFIEDMQTHNRAMWLADEWAQVLKRIEHQTYAQELRDYLLKTHDNQQIDRNTLQRTITIQDPSLVILGTTVLETFLENVSAESMLDGFMQRFQFAIAERDDARSMRNFAFYRTAEPQNLAPVQTAWAAIAALPIHPEYLLSADAEAAYESAFAELFDTHVADLRAAVPESFFRRVAWRALKYALVYHILLGKTFDTLDPEDIGWAMRVCRLHLVDAQRLLRNYQFSELEKLVQRAEALQAKLKRVPTKRELISGVRGISNASMATFILDMLKPSPSKGQGGDDTNPGPAPAPKPVSPPQPGDGSAAVPANDNAVMAIA